MSQTMPAPAPSSSPSARAKLLGGPRVQGHCMAEHRVAAQRVAARIYDAAHDVAGVSRSATAAKLQMRTSSFVELTNGTAAVTLRDIVAGPRSVREAVIAALSDLDAEADRESLLSDDLLAVQVELGDVARIAAVTCADRVETADEAREARPKVGRLMAAVRRLFRRNSMKAAG